MKVASDSASVPMTSCAPVSGRRRGALARRMRRRAAWRVWLSRVITRDRARRRTRAARAPPWRAVMSRAVAGRRPLCAAARGRADSLAAMIASTSRSARRCRPSRRRRSRTTAPSARRCGSRARRRVARCRPSPASTADAQRMRGELLRVERDAHRHALHDLDPVAGRVLRRQQRERRAGARAEADDLAVVLDLAAVQVGGQRHRLADAHACAAALP